MAVRRRSRGRPPGIHPERQATLAQLASVGLSLERMAATLGVTRQCVHTQLTKCPAIARRWQMHRRVRRRQEREHGMFQRALRLRERAIHRAQQRSATGMRLARFLRTALARGLAVEAAPKHRPRVNGATLAFHVLRCRRPTRSTHRRAAQYYQLNLVHPEWLNVVCLPTGRYLFYPPDPTRRPGSYYIPEAHAHAPQVWPDWLQRLGSRVDRTPPAWAA